MSSETCEGKAALHTWGGKQDGSHISIKLVFLGDGGVLK